MTGPNVSEEMIAVVLDSLITEHREGRDPWVTYEMAHLCLVALGRPLSPQAVRDLVLDVRPLGGRTIARLSDFVSAADAHIARRVARPNLKARAAAKARAAKSSRQSS
jgi:hypothetical protein